MSIARVEPLTTARALRGPFDYLIPERLGEITVGTVLEVPFGRRRITGVVVEIAETTEVPEEKLAEPIRILGTGTNEDLIGLGSWIAAEYSKPFIVSCEYGAGIRGFCDPSGHAQITNPPSSLRQ